MCLFFTNFGWSGSAFFDQLDPHSENLLDPDPQTMNADPQPWYTPSLPNLFLLIFFPFSIHSYLYSYLPPAILTLPSSLLTLTSCVRTYFSPYPLIFDLHSILTYIHFISFTLSFLASTLSILNLISCQPFLHSSLLTYLPSILT